MKYNVQYMKFTLDVILIQFATCSWMAWLNVKWNATDYVSMENDPEKVSNMQKTKSSNKWDQEGRA